RGGGARHVQDTDSDLRDPPQSSGSHRCKLPNMASVCGGETLYRLLQHRQHAL
ncbi:hypothetical protein M9458_005403, partial [Cirrhinus mrigala]